MQMNIAKAKVMVVDNTPINVNNVLIETMLKTGATLITASRNRCTPDCMIYGETGRGAILNVVKCRMVSFWSRHIRISCTI